jgi:CheY-like chemotaxis protein/predicted regulator of Ras-like GTPase activity (Roadblock/LC7/MglB family)
MRKKYILIVDDAKDILFLLMHSVKRLGPDYEVVTATDGVSALAQVEKQHFDVVITDYMMPGMTGIDLVQAIRKFAPDTQIVLMTAHSSRQVRHTVDTLRLGGFIGKPFTVPEVLEVVQKAIARTSQAVDAPHAIEQPALDIDKAVQEQLQTLWNKTGAHTVLLVNSDGRPLKVIGETNRTKIARLASFVASNFMAVTELASLLEDHESVFKSSYHEGSKYNIYAYDVNHQMLLAVIFGVHGKPGTVWFYTKQTGAELASLLEHVSAKAAKNNENVNVANEFEDMFGEGTG